jgi:hypothetical protein
MTLLSRRPFITLFLENVIKLILEYSFFIEGVIPTGAQRSGGICCSTHTVGFGRNDTSMRYFANLDIPQK